MKRKSTTRKEDRLAKKFKEFQSQVKIARVPLDEVARDVEKQEAKLQQSRERTVMARKEWAEAGHQLYEAKVHHGYNQEDLMGLNSKHKEKQKEFERFCLDHALSAINYAICLRDDGNNGLLHRRITECLRILATDESTNTIPDLPEAQNIELLETTGMIPALLSIVYDYTYFATCQTCHQPLDLEEHCYSPGIFYLDETRENFILGDHVTSFANRNGWGRRLIKTSCLSCAIIMVARLFYEGQSPNSKIGGSEPSEINNYYLFDAVHCPYLRAAFDLVYRGERDERIFGPPPLH